MEISDDLACLFSATLEERDGSYVIDVPERELDLGSLQSDETYRVAVFKGESSENTDRKPSRNRSSKNQSVPEPPVEEGERRKVEIEDLGDKGDGITRVERGYVIIVPDTEPGDRVTIELTEVRETVAFAEVIEREEYFH